MIVLDLICMLTCVFQELRRPATSPLTRTQLCSRPCQLVPSQVSVRIKLRQLNFKRLDYSRVLINGIDFNILFGMLENGNASPSLSQ